MAVEKERVRATALISTRMGQKKYLSFSSSKICMTVGASSSTPRWSAMNLSSAFGAENKKNPFACTSA
jgi:hypothetical protein